MVFPFGTFPYSVHDALLWSDLLGSCQLDNNFVTWKVACCPFPIMISRRGLPPTMISRMWYRFMSSFNVEQLRLFALHWSLVKPGVQGAVLGALSPRVPVMGWCCPLLQPLSHWAPWLAPPCDEENPMAAGCQQGLSGPQLFLPWPRQFGNLPAAAHQTSLLSSDVGVPVEVAAQRKCPQVIVDGLMVVMGGPQAPPPPASPHQGTWTPVLSWWAGGTSQKTPPCPLLLILTSIPLGPSGIPRWQLVVPSVGRTQCHLTIPFHPPIVYNSTLPHVTMETPHKK